MIVFLSRRLTFLLIIYLPLVSLGQNVFSEKKLDVPKSFLPYDVPYTFALEDKQFIQLSEEKNHVMKLGRYDQYFFEQWEKIIEFNEEESAPQLFVSGDTVFVYCFTNIAESGTILVKFRLFDLSDGKELPGSNYEIRGLAEEGTDPTISFSHDKRKFIVYNYLTRQEKEKKATFTVFETGKAKALSEYHLDANSIAPSQSCKIYLSDRGDVFFVSIKPGDYKIHSYFMSQNFQNVNQIDNNFFFERPIDAIGEIDITRQGISSFFVSFTSKFDNELVGFNVSGYNVILKTVMFSYNQNLRKDEIEEVYSNYYAPTDNQKKKFLQVPMKLENFRLIKNIINQENDVILIFEDLEIVSDHFESNNNMTWKSRIKKDKFYDGGDILMYCFSAGGELLWQKCIQKRQISQASGLGLSFIERVENEKLHLLMYESSDGGSFYIMTINMLDGSLVKNLELLPGEKFEFTKKYSCWLDNKSVLICGIAPANIYKRTLMLVEF